MQTGGIKNISTTLKTILLTSLLALGSMGSQAQTEKFIQTLTGNIKPGDVCTVTDDKFSDAQKWATIEKHVAVNNVITFELRYDTNAHFLSKPFDCKLTVDIEYETADRIKQQLKNIQLDVNFDTTAASIHKGIAYYKFKNGHNVKITVSKIASAAWGAKLPAAFRIKNEIFVERNYIFDTKAVATAVTSFNAKPLPTTTKGLVAGASILAADVAGQQQTITWSPIQGATQYDFEWTVYDENSAIGKKIKSNTLSLTDATLEPLFKNNSSRVTTEKTQYSLNLIYNKGYLLHRVRSVFYNEPTNERTEGAWTYVGNGINGFGVLPITGHEENLNWQYNMSFAEEGKRKEVVSYFDGSLRNRQAVTLNNDINDSKTIVQENVFDALGRPAINILPAPTEQNTIHYFREFNKSAVTNTPYQFKDIESPNVCAQEPNALSTVSGASQYYSPNNPKINDNTKAFYFSKYIPDAKGYPFTVTHFTQDNTGRIRTQGGVGAVFQPGKQNPKDDHTTKYLYDKPNQQELDRLFGNEAGNSSHYLKNTVIDANGQVSVSFVNASGKTVATALAGKSPDNLQPLPSHQINNKTIITTLTDGENIVRDPANLSINFNTSFVADAAGDFKIAYTFTPLSLQVLYGVQNDKICADCYYDMYINVTDECGTIVGTDTKPAIFTEKTTCTPTPTVVSNFIALKIIKPGEYHISYKLILSRKAIDFYTDSYLVQNSAIKKEIDFQRDYLHNIDISGCYNNCETCLADLGTVDAFVDKMTEVLLQQNITANAEDIAWMKETHKNLLAECTLLQEGCGKTELPCEEQIIQMKDDVSPGGQYMLYDDATQTFVERGLNVFLKPENKAALTMTVSINGVTKALNTLSEAELISNWKSEWADYLLPYHPENKDNCFVSNCGKNVESELFDRKFLNTEDVLTARNNKYFFGDSYKDVVDNDPYFKTGGEGAPQIALFKDKLDKYINVTKDAKYDIMSFVRWSVYCQKSTSDTRPDNITACPRTGPACDREEDEWSLFKVLYYNAKQEFIAANGSGKTCNKIASDLFKNPTDQLTGLVDGATPAPSGCANAALFTISNNNGTVTIKYTGSQKTTQAVRLQYFAVDAKNVLIDNGSIKGAVTFPVDTKEGTELTVTGGNKDYTYIIDNARCDLNAGQEYYAKTRRNFNGLSTTALTNSIGSKKPEDLNGSTNIALTNNCNESCALNADGWMARLEGCNLIIDGAEYNQIRDGLIEVCKGSCQINVMDHPFGASSVTTPTANGFKNFKDVLLKVLGAARFSDVCNELLLDYPAENGVKPLYSNEVVRALSKCAYDKLKAWTSAYAGNVNYRSFTQYVQKKIDPDFFLTDVEVNQLIKAYENNCVTPKPIALPASLSCSDAQLKTCITCNELRDEKLNFESAYSYVATTSPEYYGLLAKYINRKYNFNLSSVDIYQALENCAKNATGGGTGTTVPAAITCDAFTQAYNHFQQLKPNYFTNPNGNPNAINIFKIHLTLWLNTELNRSLSYEYYSALAAQCNVPIVLPVNDNTCPPILSHCAPQFITCCEPFAEIARFNNVFPTLPNARLLAVYFFMQRSQWCTPVNLPNIDYSLPYAAIVNYFTQFKMANGYTITVMPDELFSYTEQSTGTCTATGLNFKPDTDNGDGPWYALCNKPAQPVVGVDENSCINQQINVALGNAHVDYLTYIEELRRDYRDAYYTKCLSINPQLKLEAIYTNAPLKYHYTLYYYDQAGNLVKTIPPAGVQPVDEDPINGLAYMARISNFRKADKEYCYEFGDAPEFNGNAAITVADDPAIKQNSSPFTVEAFVNFVNLNGTQTLFTKQSVNAKDSKTDGYKIYVDNGLLKVDVAAHGNEDWVQTLKKKVSYTFPAYIQAFLPPALQNLSFFRKVEQPPVSRDVYRSVTAAITSNINSLISRNQQTHIAVQHTGDWKNPIRIYINGSLVNTTLTSNITNYTPATSPVLSATEIAAGTTELSFAYKATTIPLNVSNTTAANAVVGNTVANASVGLNGTIKQVRVYNRALSATEIRNNAFNTCLTPQNEGNLVLWLPLHKETKLATSEDRINQIETVNSNTVFSTAFQPVYPTHKLPTHYYYNSLNAVVKQVSPDGGESNFWYDLLGRLVVSQNAEQLKSNSIRAEADNRYSYTKYDAQGRIIEVGEKSAAATMTTSIAKTDPTITGSAINNWLNTGTNTQITQTIYDQPDVSIVGGAIAANLNVYNTARKRVVATIYRNTNTTTTNPTDYNSATHYQYDINGNVKRLWQEHKKSITGDPVNLLKDLTYNYDLVSGKVNYVIYQKDKGDQFIYKYHYDPDNRLIAAFSGRDIKTLQLDASYRYYLHGPLARMELGDATTSRIVQGSDYAYTLQGWLKGVNGTMLGNGATPGLDMGNDGSNVTAGALGAQVAQDAIAYTLGYYQNDYTAIGGGTLAPAFGIQYQHPATTALDVTGKALFNGNISNALYAINKIDNGAARGYSYGYDQLNRLREMRAHGSLPTTTTGGSWNNSTVLADHKETYTYDANGNILKLFRNGTTAAGRSLAMDDMTYSYYYYDVAGIRKTYNPANAIPADGWTLTNQLAHVKDGIAANAYPLAAFADEKDIDNQADNNYTYDGIGNLIADNAENIKAIKWTVYGKIRSIDKTDGTSIIYDYDASGNRIQKQVIAAGVGSAARAKTITYYVRDAQGNTMAVYSWKGNDKQAVITTPDVGRGLVGETWDEQHLYGSSRLGMWQPKISVPLTLNTTTDAVNVGSKFFELTNHLGNVLATVSDRKIPHIDPSGVIDYFMADVTSAQDYAPFGMSMVGRGFSAGSYRFGFNGKENDKEVKGEGNQIAFEARIYDPRIGRWLSVDPLTDKFSNLSPYLNSENNPIYFMDNDGREPNRSQAASWVKIKSVLVNFFKNPENQSIHKLRYTEGAGGGGGQVGPFGGKDGPRYVYTEKYGWVDLGHFFQVTSEIQKKANESFIPNWSIHNSITAYLISKNELWKKTEEVENGQPEGSETQWSYEDAPSNLAGMDFWFSFYDNDGNLLEKLEDFFKDAEIKKPEDAPNYKTMPDKPQKKRWFSQNKSFKANKNPTPTEDNKKASTEKKDKNDNSKTSTSKKKKS